MLKIGIYTDVVNLTFVKKNIIYHKNQTLLMVKLFLIIFLTYLIKSKVFAKNNELDGLIFHSDQELQCQHESYQQKLKNRGIIQNMSGNRNSTDDRIIEKILGSLRDEMVHDQ